MSDHCDLPVTPLQEPTARRIGVFGGAFDPPHRAHQALAQVAIEQLGLEQLRIIPTGQAWHKPRTLSAAHHRLAMAELAFADVPGAVVDPREIQRSGPSYTVDTLAELHAENPGASLFLLMGDDQARSLRSWHRWQELPQLATICVAVRGDSTGASIEFDAKQADAIPFCRLAMPPVDLSATAVRECLSLGQDISALVIEPIARYIAENHLYQTS